MSIAIYGLIKKLFNKVKKLKKKLAKLINRKYSSLI